MADHTSGELLVLKDFVGDEFNTRSHDIVAVHGWCCSQGVSWAYQGKDGTWLQNLLPTYIGPSRVMTFNYCVDSEHGISTSTTRHIALSLLAQLLKFETDGSRNLVFIGHDVGGVVIKQALNIAVKSNDYCSVAARTSLLVFFGTPHRALNLGDWEEMVCRMILTGSKRHLGRLTEVISTSSRALKKASNDFRTLERVYTVVNIFEDGGHDPVVSPFSATFGQEGEQKVARMKRHAELGFFSDGLDPAFKQLCKMVKYSQSHGAAYIDCISTLWSISGVSLSVANMSSRLLRWLQSHDVYLKWLASLDGILLIHGESVIDLPILETLFTQESNSGDSHSIGFLFESGQNSVFSMLASLAAQLLCAVPDLFDHFFPMYDFMTKRTGWTINTLWVFFRTIANCPNHQKVICFIGAIERCDLAERLLLNRVLHWADITRSILKVIVTSSTRLYDPITSHMICSDTELSSMRKNDIEDLIKEEILCLLYDRPAFETIRKEPEKKIEQAAQQFQLDIGNPLICLSAKLILSLIRKLPNWSSKKCLEDRLNALPTTLNSIYLEMLSKVSSSRRAWAQKVLSWMVWARRPLKLSELSVAVALGEYTRSISEIENELSQDLSSELKDTFGSLIYTENGEARFLHESFSKFLVDPKQNCIQLHPDEPLWSEGEGVIARTCLNYLMILSTEGVSLTSSRLNSSCGLMDYAVQYWPEHYQSIGTTTASLNDFFLNQDLMKTWSSWYWENQHPMTRGPSPDPLTVAAESNCVDLLKVVLETPEKNPAGVSTALEVALKNGHREIIRIMLDSGATKPSALSILASFGHHDLLIEFSQYPAYAEQWPPPVYVACEGGHLQIIRELIKAGANVNAQDLDGMTPLHIACQFGHVEIISALLEEHASVNVAAENKATPLHIACKWQQPHAVEKLLQSQVKIDVTDNSDMTPIHIAAEAGRVDIMNLFFSQSAEARFEDENWKHELLVKRDKTGSTPLHLAVKRCHKEAVEILLGIEDTQQGPRATMILDDAGYNPLRIAARNGSADIVTLLLEEDPAQISSFNDDENTPMHLAVLAGKVEVVEAILAKVEAGTNILDNLGADKLTALHTATRNGNSEIVKLLLDSGATPSVADPDYQTPLIAASEKGFVEIAQLLLDVGVDVDLRDNKGCSALSFASLEGHTEIVKLLLDYHADANFPDINGNSSLHQASRNGCLEIVELLLPVSEDHIGDPRNKDGRTPLSYAAENGHLEIVQLLAREREVDKCLGDNNNRTPLLYAAENGKEKTVQYLLDAPDLCADQNRANRYGQTSLWFAARGGDEKVVRLLLERGEDPNTADDDGWTPLHIAGRNGFEAVIDAILDSNKVTTLNMKNSDGFTSLYLASYHGKVSTVARLVKQKADPEIAGMEGWRPLHAAYNSTAVLQLLLRDAKADANSKSNDGSTALHYVALWGDEDSAKILLNFGADPLLPDDEQATPLHFAYNVSDDVVRLMLEKANPPMDLKDGSGNTPLLKAVKHNSFDQAKVLLESGHFNVNEVNHDRQSALWFAICNANVKIVELLLGSVDLTPLEEEHKDLLLMAAERGLTSVLDFPLFKAQKLAAEDRNEKDEHGWRFREITAALQPRETRSEIDCEFPEHRSPSRWSKTVRYNKISIRNDDGKTIQYFSDDDNDIYPGIVRADHPVPALSKFYFEVTVIDSGHNGEIGVGFCYKHSPVESFPGWRPDSWGYHGDDGGMYHDNSRESGNNGPYGKGEVIGCHIDMVQGTARFTKDGKPLENIFQGLKGRLFPVVGMRSRNAEVVVNFGPDNFKYPVDLTSEEN